MKLTKMHGLGNDFILFADPQGANKDYTDLAIRLCDRRTGIGADGLAILVPSKTCDVRMRIINSDGSEAECAAMQSVALPNMPMNTEKLLKKLSPSKPWPV